MNDHPSVDVWRPVESGRHTDEDDARRSTQWIAETLERLSHSSFRSSFTLSPHDAAYARRKGRELIDRHAHEMLARRVGAAQPEKDGKQTPWRGHPVFTAQHATACCCRGCIEKWHHIPRGRALSAQEVDRLARLVMAWIDRDLAAHPAVMGDSSGWTAPFQHQRDGDTEQGGRTAQPRRPHGSSGGSAESRRHPGNHYDGNASGFVQGELL